MSLGHPKEQGVGRRGRVVAAGIRVTQEVGAPSLETWFAVGFFVEPVSVDIGASPVVEIVIPQRGPNTDLPECGMVLTCACLLRI
jgi:hypothetical protein